MNGWVCEGEGEEGRDGEKMLDRRKDKLSRPTKMEWKGNSMIMALGKGKGDGDGDDNDDDD